MTGRLPMDIDPATPVYVVGPPSNTRRRQSILESFDQENLVFPGGVDGYELWERLSGRDVPKVSKGADYFWEPTKEELAWYLKAFNTLRLAGVVDGSPEIDSWSLSPGEVGCALSHKHVWMEFLKSGHSWGIFIEDDVMVRSQKRRLWELFYELWVSVPGPVDALFGQGGVGISSSSYASRVLKLCGAYCYALNRKAAAAALEAMTPIVFPLDIQWYVRAFSRYRGTDLWEACAKPIAFPQMRKVDAYGSWDPFVELSDHNKASTIWGE